MAQIMYWFVKKKEQEPEPEKLQEDVLTDK